MSAFHPHKIKSILFDLGGVLLNIDYSLTEKAFRQLGLDDFDHIYNQAKQDGLFDEFEKGHISRHDFVEVIMARFSSKPKKEEIEKSWNAMLLDFPSERVDMLMNLKKSHHIFLLSNTNEIHYEAFNILFEKSFNLPFSSLFEKDYYSHLMRMRKPDIEIFDRILQENNLSGEELLFIDDSEQHVHGAVKAGLQALHLEKGDDLVSLLRRINILA